MWLQPATAFTQQKPSFLLSLDFFFSSLSHCIQCNFKSVSNSVKIRAHFLLCTAYSQNWPPKNFEQGRSRIIFPLWIKRLNLSSFQFISFYFTFNIVSFMCVLNLWLALLCPAPAAVGLLAVPAVRHTPQPLQNSCFSLLLISWLANMSFLSPFLPSSCVYSSNLIM